MLVGLVDGVRDKEVLEGCEGFNGFCPTGARRGGVRSHGLAR